MRPWVELTFAVHDHPIRPALQWLLLKPRQDRGRCRHESAEAEFEVQSGADGPVWSKKDCDIAAVVMLAGCTIVCCRPRALGPGPGASFMKWARAPPSQKVHLDPISLSAARV